MLKVSLANLILIDGMNWFSDDKTKTAFSKVNFKNLNIL